GNRDASVDNHFNFAMNAKRRPGSTFKPLAVYAPGIDLGVLQPATVLADVPDRPGYSPDNYGNTHYRIVTAREALTKYHNTSTVEPYKKIITKKQAENNLEKINFNI